MYIFKSIFTSVLSRRKTIKGAMSDSPNLSRKLSLMDVVFMGLGATIGAGVFVVIGAAASNHAGPAVCLSFILSALVLMMIAFCYAELSTKIPVSGGAYSYVYVAFGEAPAWIVGSVFLLTYIVCISSVAAGFSSYIVAFLKGWNLDLPTEITSGFGERIRGVEGATGIVNLPSVISLIIAATVISQDVKIYSRFNTAIVLIKVSVLALFITFGSAHVDTSLWYPFIPENTGEFGKFGYSGIIGGAAASIFAFIGFESLASTSQELIRPEKDLPRGIIWTLIISAAIYAIVSLVVTGLVHYTELGVPHPMAIAMSKIDIPAIKSLVVAGIVVGLFAVIMMLTYGLTRGAMIMVHDGLLPEFLGHLDPKTQTPKRLTWFIACIMMCVVNLFPINLLVSLSNLGVLITFTIVCITNIYMRYTCHHNMEGKFVCPMMPILPIVAMVSISVIVYAMDSCIFVYLLYYLAFMALFYVLYGRQHSKMAK